MNNENCPRCGGSIDQPKTGRRRKYCSDACRISVFTRQQREAAAALRPIKVRREPLPLRPTPFRGRTYTSKASQTPVHPEESELADENANSDTSVSVGTEHLGYPVPEFPEGALTKRSVSRASVPVQEIPNPTEPFPKSHANQLMLKPVQV